MHACAQFFLRKIYPLITLPLSIPFNNSNLLASRPFQFQISSEAMTTVQLFKLISLFKLEIPPRWSALKTLQRCTSGDMKFLFYHVGNTALKKQQMSLLILMKKLLPGWTLTEWCSTLTTSKQCARQVSVKRFSMPKIPYLWMPKIL